MEEKDKKVKLNQADTNDLQALPGVGKVLAGRIVERRESAGPFGDVSELAEVKGISRSMVDKVADRVDLEAAEAAAETPPMEVSLEEAIPDFAGDEALLEADEPQEVATEAAVAQAAVAQEAGVEGGSEELDQALDTAPTVDVDEDAAAVEQTADEGAALDETAVEDTSEPPEAPAEPADELDEDTEDILAAIVLPDQEEESGAEAGLDDEELDDEVLEEAPPEAEREVGAVAPAEAEPEPEVAAPARAKATPVAATPARSGSGNLWAILLGMAFSVLLGAALALGLLFLLNEGTLRFGSATGAADLRRELSRQNDELLAQRSAVDTQLESLETQADELQTEVEGLARQQERLASALSQTDADVGALEAAVTALETQIAEVAAAAKDFSAFLDGLRTLLNDLGETAPAAAPDAGPETTRESGPSPTPGKTDEQTTTPPAPTATPRPTRTPRPTATPLDLGRATPTP